MLASGRATAIIAYPPIPSCRRHTLRRNWPWLLAAVRHSIARLAHTCNWQRIRRAIRCRHAAARHTLLSVASCRSDETRRGARRSETYCMDGRQQLTERERAFVGAQRAARLATADAE